MPSYQKTSQLPAPDIAIIGGGIVGLWTAFYAAQSYQNVLLIEKGSLGSTDTASNGILGALMPHQPINWNDKKQFQLDGLTSLPNEILRLESETNIKCGYFRCGRVMPIANSEKRRQSENWSQNANKVWHPSFKWTVQDNNPAKNWLAPKGTHGYNTDTLSARVNPRNLIKALIENIKQTNNITIFENTTVEKINPNGSSILSNKETINAEKTIITAGYKSFGLLQTFAQKPLGWGVKGQAALLRPVKKVDVSAPILYDNGIYVIIHENGTVAVGSTSERHYNHSNDTDTKLDHVIEKAKTLCPALENATIIERWASIRPRAVGRDPMIGSIPNQPNIIVATGGFKITFAIAHMMAQSALSVSKSDQTVIPHSFTIDAHIKPH